MKGFKPVLFFLSAMILTTSCHKKAVPTVSPFLEKKSAWGLVAEMNQVIWQGKLPSSEMAGWVNVLMQGASVEGVYRGWVLSDQFREFELKSAPASEAVRKTWIEGLHIFRPELPFQTLNEKFLKSSPQTLSKILADEFLKSKDPQAFFKILEWSQKSEKIDFGLAERNRTDLEFHSVWFKSAPTDVKNWESLNRIFRVLIRSSK